LALVAALVGSGSAACAQPIAHPLPSGVDLSQPVALADCVRIAMAVNPQLALADEAVRQARAAVTETRAAQLPNLQFQGDAGKQKLRGSGTSSGGSSPGTSPSTFSWGANLVLSQTLYQSGLFEQVGSAKAGERASRFGATDARRTVVLNVAQSYYTAVAAKALVGVAARSLEASTRHIERAEARVEQGVAAPADVYPFRVEIAQARLQVITAETQFQNGLTSLKQVIGLPAQVPLQLADDFGRPELAEKVEDLLHAAYETRPDVLQQKALVESARLNARVAEIQHGPVLDVSGNVAYGLDNDAAGTDGLVQAAVTFPVFDGGLTKAKADSARSALRAARDTLQQLELAVSAQVESDYLTAVQANHSIDAAEAAVQAAEISLKAAEGKYAEGVGTVIDVTDAQLKLTQSDSDRVQAYFTYNTALAALRAAIGRMAAPGAE
jgi:outer membrane protein